MHFEVHAISEESESETINLKVWIQIKLVDRISSFNLDSLLGNA